MEHQEQVDRAVKIRRTVGGASAMMDVSGLGASVTVFEARYGGGYIALIGPIVFAQLLQDELIWGTNEATTTLEELLNGHMWFPAAYGVSYTAAMRALEAKLQAMDDLQYSKLLRGMFTLKSMKTPAIKPDLGHANWTIVKDIKDMEYFVARCFYPTTKSD